MSDDQFYATGKRKNAIARVWLKPGTGKIVVNERPVDEYFRRPTSRMVIMQPFELTQTVGRFDTFARVRGGGLSGQAGAVKHGISKALLGVDPASIEKHGAVSRQVVEQMARGARERFGTDYSIATSGIAGPDGGTPEKPVGTTWIAVASAHSISSEVYRLGDHRGRNIQKAALTGLNMLRNHIINNK